jgi:hypothetical protein
MAAADGDGKREEKSKSKSRPPQTKSLLLAPRVGLAGALKKQAAWWWPEKGSRVGLDGALTNGVEQALSPPPPASGSSPGVPSVAVKRCHSAR